MAAPRELVGAPLLEELVELAELREPDRVARVHRYVCALAELQAALGALEATEGAAEAAVYGRATLAAVEVTLGRIERRGRDSR